MKRWLPSAALSAVESSRGAATLCHQRCSQLGTASQSPREAAGCHLNAADGQACLAPFVCVWQHWKQFVRTGLERYLVFNTCQQRKSCKSKQNTSQTKVRFLADDLSLYLCGRLTNNEVEWSRKAEYPYLLL